MPTTPPTITVTESHALLNALLQNSGSPKALRRSLRNYTMALIMLDAGLRVGEVTTLDASLLWWNGGPVRSLVLPCEKSRNRRERSIPLGSRLRIAITDMAARVWPSNASITYGPAFYRETTGEPLTTRQVERIIRKAAIKAIGRPVHPHVLRHTFATRVLAKANTRVVQELLGHTHISSTEIYTHPGTREKEQAILDMERAESQAPYYLDDVAADNRGPHLADASRAQKHSV